MRSKAESVRPSTTAAGLVLALLAASPAIKASGLSGTALAAGTPPAVAQPAGAASNPAVTTTEKAPATAAVTPAENAPATAAVTPAGGAALPAAAATVNAPVGAAADTARSATAAPDLLYRRTPYLYGSSSLRDPFQSLVSGAFVADNSYRLPDVGSLQLLGVMWGDNDRFALLENNEGQGYVLRVGDPVVNGEVSAITRDSITIRQYFFGTSTTVTLKLKPREGSADAKNKRK